MCLRFINIAYIPFIILFVDLFPSNSVLSFLIRLAFQTNLNNPFNFVWVYVYIAQTGYHANNTGPLLLLILHAINTCIIIIPKNVVT